MTPGWSLQVGGDDSLPTLSLPDAWQAVDLVSDLHLSPQVPATVAAFEHYLGGTRADAVLLLGDVFEVWIGDDVLADPCSFESHRIAALQAAGRRCALAFMPGNRDFLVGAAMSRAAGWLALDDPTCLDAWGQRLVLMHGDALCLDDVYYQRFRSQVRSAQWRAGFLAQPLSQRQAIAAQLRAASEARKREIGPEGYGDLDPSAMRCALIEAGAQVLIHGHTHRPGTESLGPALRRWVLSDWDLEPDSTHPRARVLRLTRSGLQTLSPDEACRA